MAKAYIRLENDERRRMLVAIGEDVFTRHAFDEVSMAQIAREAGISKALLYHYFPSKRDYFVATLSEGAEALRAAIEPDPDVPPHEALSASVGAYLAWIDAHGDSYRKLLQSAWSVPEVRTLVENVREETAARIIDGLDVDDPAARTAVYGWLWFMDGACLHWLDHRDMDLQALHDLALGALAATLGAAGALAERALTTMPSATADRLTRRVIPRVVVTLSRLDGLAQLDAKARRALGRRGRVELFFAFDDPCSAIAVIDLADRLAGRDVRLILEPVIQRGIAGDPAVDDKRRYAIDDARRLGRRTGMTLSRSEPIPAQETAFLAAWTSAIPAGPAQTRFCVEALRRLWFGSDGRVDLAPYEALWRELVGSPPPTPPVPVQDATRANERRMKRRGPYDTPAAWVHGQWFFAHDRLVQIGERLDDLGWTEHA